MDINDLKNTSDAQFSKDVTFDLPIPDDSGEELKLTIKSVRNPNIKPKFTKLVNDVTKETAKLDKPNISDSVTEAVNAKVAVLEEQICELVFVKFEGLKDGDKVYPSNKATMQNLVANYEWIRKAIVDKAASTDAFYKV